MNQLGILSRSRVGFKEVIKMTPFDKQRIENAIWTLERYREELDDLDAETIVDGVWFNVSDALRVLDLALYKLTK